MDAGGLYPTPSNSNSFSSSALPQVDNNTPTASSTSHPADSTTTTTTKPNAASSIPFSKPLGLETFHGFVETSLDALLLIEGCRRGILKPVTSKPKNASEVTIRSGSCFVFEERATGMKRWRDPLRWSPSRVAGPFLLYREIDTAPGHERPKKKAGLSTSNTVSKFSDTPTTLVDSSGADAVTTTTTTTTSEYTPLGPTDPSKVRGLDPTYSASTLKLNTTLKPDGLIKKAMAVTYPDRSKYHVVAYFARREVVEGRLEVPSKSLLLREIHHPASGSGLTEEEEGRMDDNEAGRAAEEGEADAARSASVDMSFADGVTFAHGNASHAAGKSGQHQPDTPESNAGPLETPTSGTLPTEPRAPGSSTSSFKTLAPKPHPPPPPPPPPSSTSPGQLSSSFPLPPRKRPRDTSHSPPTTITSTTGAAAVPPSPLDPTTKEGFNLLGMKAVKKRGSKRKWTNGVVNVVEMKGKGVSCEVDWFAPVASTGTTSTTNTTTATGGGGGGLGSGSLVGSVGSDGGSVERKEEEEEEEEVKRFGMKGGDDGLEGGEMRGVERYVGRGGDEEVRGVMGYGGGGPDMMRFGGVQGRYAGGPMGDVMRRNSFGGGGYDMGMGMDGRGGGGGPRGVGGGYEIGGPYEYDYPSVPPPPPPPPAPHHHMQQHYPPAHPSHHSQMYAPLPPVLPPHHSHPYPPYPPPHQPPHHPHHQHHHHHQQQPPYPHHPSYGPPPPPPLPPSSLARPYTSNSYQHHSSGYPHEYHQHHHHHRGPPSLQQAPASNEYPQHRPPVTHYAPSSRHVEYAPPPVTTFSSSAATATSSSSSSNSSTGTSTHQDTRRVLPLPRPPTSSLSTASAGASARPSGGGGGYEQPGGAGVGGVSWEV
ncbi:hypothetical protein HDV05_007968 [Chytridiales sp. JEL 0842]|nr:hypothetical protein HDV05_007968 [Chytridiales sp. JEL 0842]